jgi:tRNA (guanine37-N1)-methyltransferase
MPTINNTKICKIFVLTLFPEYFIPLSTAGVVGQLLQGKRKSLGNIIQFEVIDIRKFSLNQYKSVDDSPYGGGPGMVMRPDVLARALREGVWENFNFGKRDDPVELLKQELHVVIPSPRGKKWNHGAAVDLAKQVTGREVKQKSLVFICARYEGMDERFIEKYGDATYGLGDFILSGGEIAALAMLDSLIRFIPGTLGNEESLKSESFQDDLLEYPQYTRPQNFEEMLVPDVLCHGDHAKIENYQFQKRLESTKFYRPDLWLKYYSQFLVDDQSRN